MDRTGTGRNHFRRADLPSTCSREKANESDWLWKDRLGDQFPRIMAQGSPIRFQDLTINRYRGRAHSGDEMKYIPMDENRW